MPDVGAYGFYIVAAYAVSLAGLGGLAVFCVFESRAVRRALRAEEQTQ